MTILLREQLEAATLRQDITKRLLIAPILDPQDQIGGTVDLRLGTEFVEVQRHAETAVDALGETGAGSGRVRDEPPLFIPLGGSLAIHPGQFMLGATLEFIRLPPDISGQVLGRSSWGRLGLVVATAVVVQPGFSGVLTLELYNAGSVPILLYPGLRVAQLQLWMAEAETALPPVPPQKRFAAPLGPEGNRPAWKPEERDRLRKIGKQLAGGVP